MIEEIGQLWPGCKIVHGRARHSESNGGVERLNRTVQEALGTWLQQHNKSKRWATGRLFVRWIINTSHHRTVGSTPYKLAFGQRPTAGLSHLPLSKELLDSLTTELQA